MKRRETMSARKARMRKRSAQRNAMARQVARACRRCRMKVGLGGFNFFYVEDANGAQYTVTVQRMLKRKDKPPKWFLPLVKAADLIAGEA
jgi:hypothetical protein